MLSTTYYLQCAECHEGLILPEHAHLGATWRCRSRVTCPLMIITVLTAGSATPRTQSRWSWPSSTLQRPSCRRSPQAHQWSCMKTSSERTWALSTWSIISTFSVINSKCGKWTNVCFDFDFWIFQLNAKLSSCWLGSRNWRKKTARRSSRTAKVTW